jgi:prepilin-type N-terminal cleavage/methylation domain-containing protein
MHYIFVMFNPNPSSCRAASPSGRGGFTLVELLVVIGIIAILASVSLGPLINARNIALHNATVQTVHQIGEVFFAYSTDNTANGNLYPADSTALAISQDLMNANYVSDPSIFGIRNQSGYQAATSSGTSVALKAQSVSWSYTCASLGTGGGISSAASDLTPLIFYNNGWSTAVVGTIQGGTGSGISVSYGANAPFGEDGAAVFYKGSNAVYLKAGLNGTAGQVANFVSANDTDSTKYVVAP